MLTVIATLPVQPGKEPELEEIFTKLAADVRANEKGCPLYSLNRMRKEPGTYVVVERYVDDAAFKHHGQTPYFLAAFPKIGSVLAGAPRIDILDEVL